MSETPRAFGHLRFAGRRHAAAGRGGPRHRGDGGVAGGAQAGRGAEGGDHLRRPVPAEPLDRQRRHGDDPRRGAGAADRRGAHRHLRSQRPQRLHLPLRPADGCALRDLGQGQRRVRQPVQGFDRRPGGGPGRVERQPPLGAGLLPDLGDAHLRRAAGADRPRVRPRVPRRPVQHRRPGPGDHGRDRRRAGRLPPAAAGRPAPRWWRCSRPSSSAGFWGFIPGILKARTGAHEVITTIMLNYVALFFLGWLIVQRGVQDPDRSDAISKAVDGSARLPRLLESSARACGSASASCWRSLVDLGRRLAPAPLDVRLRAARGRPQPGCLPHGRHQRRRRRTSW